MASRPANRDGFNIAIICALPLEYDAVELLFEEEWDDGRGDPYGKAVGDRNWYKTGRMGGADVVLLLLPTGGKVDAASATASLRSSFSNVKLVLLTGLCAGVPFPVIQGRRAELLLGDVVVGQTVIQHDFGAQNPNGFVRRDNVEDVLGRLPKEVRGFVNFLVTANERQRIETQAAVYLKHIQAKHSTYQYPGAGEDKLFPASHRHKHHDPFQDHCATCHKGLDSCDESRDLSCDDLGCDTRLTVSRKRLEAEGSMTEVQVPSLFVGRIGSGDKEIRSGEHRDTIAKLDNLLAFEGEVAGVWDEVPCIAVKGVCNYADSHKSGKENAWQNFAVATAASVMKAILRRYAHHLHPKSQQQQQQSFSDEDRACLRDLCVTDPRHDKTEIEQRKGGLLQNSYIWVMDNVAFKQWRDDPQARMLWIKGDSGKGKTMLLCGIIDEMQNDAAVSSMHFLSYFFCQATEAKSRSATAVLRGLIYLLVEQKPSLIGHVRKQYDNRGKQLFEGRNALAALSKMMEAMLEDPNSKGAVLIIDALDECIDDRPFLLDFISNACSSHPSRWIVSSRNWPEVERKLVMAEHKVGLNLELNQASISAAVQAYIQYKVNMLEENGVYDGDTVQYVHQRLLSKANDTFLWVALVCQRLESLDNWNVRKAIEEMPAGLVELYEHMMQLIEKLEHRNPDLCRRILLTVTLAYRPLHLEELSGLSDLQPDVGTDVATITKLSRLCGSFLTVKDGIVYVIHQSVKDFLSKNSFLFPLGKTDVQQEHRNMVLRLLTLFPNTLRRDIYNLGSPGFLTEDVTKPDPDPLVPLRYSCVHWADHVGDWDPSQRTIQECGKVTTAMTGFLQTNFLHWLEALSLLGSLSAGVLAIQKLEALFAGRCIASSTPKKWWWTMFWLTTDTAGEKDMRQLAQLLADASRFIRFHKPAIEIAPLQVYVSAIVFSPTESNIRRLYNREEPEFHPSLKPSMENDWSPHLQTLEGHKNQTTFMAFSADGQRLASHSYDETARIWDAVTGDCLHILRGLEGSVPVVVWSVNGSRLACASYSEQRKKDRAKVWDIFIGTCVLLFEGLDFALKNWDLNPVVLSSDGLLLALAEVKAVKVWDVDKGVCLQSLPLQSSGGPVASIIFVPTGVRFATFGIGEIKIWEARQGASSGTCIQTLQVWGHLGANIQLSADGQRLVLIQRRTGQIWNMVTGALINQFKFKRRIHACVLVKNTLRLAVEQNEVTRVIEISDTAAQTCIQKIDINIGRIGLLRSPVAFSPDGKRLAVTNGHAVTIFNTSPGSLPVKREGFANRLCKRSRDIFRIFNGPKLIRHESRVDHLVFLGNGQPFASGSCYSTILVWDAITGACLHVIDPKCTWSTLQFSGDGRRAAVRTDADVRVYTLAGVLVCRIDNERSEFGPIALSSDGERLAVKRNKEVDIWNTATGHCIHTLHGFKFRIGSIVFSENGQRLGVSEGQIIKIWGTNTNGTCLQTLECKYNCLHFVFSRDNQQLASLRYEFGIWERGIDIWDLTTGACIQTLGTAFRMRQLSLDPQTDSRLLTDTGAFDVNFGAAGTESKTPSQHSIPGYGLSHDRDWILKDGERLLWLPPQHRGWISSVRGSTVAIAYESGAVSFMRLSEPAPSSGR